MVVGIDNPIERFEISRIDTTQRLSSRTIGSRASPFIIPRYFILRTLPLIINYTSKASCI